MREPIENEYFNWLCAKVLEAYNHNYYSLLGILHKTEFVWVVSADKHRAEDGLDLRLDFLRETGSERDLLWQGEPCSIFELLISFAKRASFETDISVKEWFWILMTNLRLEEYRRVSNADVPLIEDILYTFVWRQYDPNGFGGLFPMNHTLNDQRKIEIWYQFYEWIDDQGL